MAKFTIEDAHRVAEEIGLDFNDVRFGVDQFAAGMDIELEHGSRDPRTDVTRDDPILTGKIAWAHLEEIPDYYTRLAIMEREAENGQTTLAELAAGLEQLTQRVTALSQSLARQQLDSWRTRIEDLELRANLAGMELRDEAEPYLKDLRARWSGIRSQLAESGVKASDVWDVLVDGMERAFSELRDTLEKTKETIGT